MSSELIEAIQTASSEVRNDTVERLRTGIRIPSVNPALDSRGGEAAFQAAFADDLRSLGCRVEMWEPDGLPGRPNVIGWVPAAEPAEGTHAHLILNSHADTVTPGDLEAWAHPPFDGALHSDGAPGGAVCGLGAADAKGCLYTFIGALMVLRRAAIRLRRSIMIQSVVDEESGGAGVLSCLQRGYSGTAAIVGEPTDLRICPASRGAMGLRMRVYGRRAHPGEGWRGVNAIRKAWQYVDALDRLRDELDRTQMHPLWAGLPVAHVWNLMGISGGAAAPGPGPNPGPTGRSVPDVCDLAYGIGLIGGESPAAMRATVEAALAAVTAADPWLSAHPPEVTWAGAAFEAAVTDATHPAVVALAEAARELGGPVVVEAFSAASDARHLTNTGGIPSINFGPGALHLAHSPHERLPVDELRKAIEILALFLVRYCGIANAYC
jgi:acetylornithine deacetylase